MEQVFTGSTKVDILHVIQPTVSKTALMPMELIPS